MKTFDSFSDLKRKDPGTYELLNRLCGSRYWNHSANAMDAPGMYLTTNPYFLSGEQAKRIISRAFEYESLQTLPLSEIVDGWHYGQEQCRVGDQVYFIFDGNIFGWMQGMFMCIDKHGRINT